MIMCCILFLGFLPVGPIYAEEAYNPWVPMELVNAGFEQPLDEHGQIPGWKQTIGIGGFTLTDEMSSEGQHSLYIEDLSTNDNYGMLSVYLPAEAGNTYSVTSDTFVLEGTAIIYLQFHSGDEAKTRIGQKSMGQSVQNEWIPLTASAVAPAGTEYVSVLINSGKTTLAKAYFDNIVLSVYMPEQEGPPTSDAIVNPGFEGSIGPNGLPVGWTQTIGSGGYRVADEMKFEGERSLYMEDLDNTKGLGLRSVFLPAEAGTKYTAKAQTYVLEGTATIYLQFHSGDENKTRIGHTSLGQSTRNIWIPLSVTLTAPEGTQYVSVLINSSNAAVTKAYIDNIELFADIPEPEVLLPAGRSLRSPRICCGSEPRSIP